MLHDLVFDLGPAHDKVAQALLLVVADIGTASYGMEHVSIDQSSCCCDASKAQTQGTPTYNCLAAVSVTLATCWSRLDISCSYLADSWLRFCVLRACVCKGDVWHQHIWNDSGPWHAPCMYACIIRGLIRAVPTFFSMSLLMAFGSQVSCSDSASSPAAAGSACFLGPCLGAMEMRYVVASGGA